MGYMYEHGLGVEQSFEMAAGYYYKAAVFDDEAYWLLASLNYRKGEFPIPQWAREELIQKD